MKFHQLPIGARFRYRDAGYRKISPLKAHNEGDDTHKLIPRSAVVSRIADAAANGAAPGLSGSLPGTAVETGTWRLVDDCRAALDGIEPPLDAEQRTQLVAAIEVAAQKMLSSLAAD